MNSAFISDQNHVEMEIDAQEKHSANWPIWQGLTSEEKLAKTLEAHDGR